MDAKELAEFKQSQRKPGSPAVDLDELERRAIEARDFRPGSGTWDEAAPYRLLVSDPRVLLALIAELRELRRKL